MEFFQVSPLGRILNRFSSDTSVVDDALPFDLNILLAQFAAVIGKFVLFSRILNNNNNNKIVISSVYLIFFYLFILGVLVTAVYGIPWLCLFIAPLIPIYHWLQNRYRHTSRELKRITSVVTSPLFSHVSETLSGMSVIRAFRQSFRYLYENLFFLIVIFFLSYLNNLFRQISSYVVLDFRKKNGCSYLQGNKSLLVTVKLFY